MVFMMTSCSNAGGYQVSEDVYSPILNQGHESNPFLRNPDTRLLGQFVIKKAGNVRINTRIRRVSFTIFAVGKQEVLHIESVCSSSYPAGNAHALYCHLWPVWLYHIFPHYIKKVTLFEKRLLNIKCVFRFSVQLCLKHI